MRASRRGSGDCVGRLRRAEPCTIRAGRSRVSPRWRPRARRRHSASKQRSSSSSSGSSSSSSMVAQRIPPEAWPQLFGYIRGRGERGWFPAPQSLIVGAGARRSKGVPHLRCPNEGLQGGCFRFYTARTWCLRKQGTWRRPQWRAQCGRDQIYEYATQGSNPGLADPRQVCYSHT